MYLFEELTSLEAKAKSQQLQEHASRKLSIFIVRDSTLEPITPFLNYFLLRRGIDPSISFSDYSGFRGNCTANTEWRSFDAIIIALSTLFSFPDMEREFRESSDLQHLKLSATIRQLFESNLERIRAQTSAPLLITAFPFDFSPSWGLADSRYGKRGYNSLIERVNQELHEACLQYKDAYLIDTNLIVGRIGAKEFSDFGKASLFGMAFTHRALKELSLEYAKYLGALTGHLKKCLILDCDNTLWGGVVGEDLLEGLRISEETIEGKRFLNFQNYLRTLRNKGVILSLCSKNNQDDVKAVFLEKPHMPLSWTSFSASRINWESKVDNIRAIAQELNIGLDACVFVDDSPFECELVNNYLPEVRVYQMGSDPVELADTIRREGLFDTLDVTETDRTRADQYQSEALRKELARSTTDQRSFLEALDMHATISSCTYSELPRVLQLIQRTNQFNLNGCRYSETDLTERLNDSTYDLTLLQLRDKFGDLGIVGFAMVRNMINETVLESIVVSCRALGRGAEDAFIYSVLRSAQKQQHRRCTALFKDSGKNKPLKQCLDRLGFLQDKTGAREDLFIELDQDLPIKSEHIKIIMSGEE